MSSARTGLVVAGAVALTAGTAAAAFGIVGGTTAQQAPSWMGSLQLPGGMHECGAALVSASWAVTAKHCVQEPLVQARFGSLDYAAGGQLVGITGTVPGPDGSDTALVHLAQPVSGAPIPLAASAPPAGTGVTLLGWGRTTPQPQPAPPRFLRQLQTQVAAPGTCTQANGAYDLCLTSTTAHTACYGDSGGPAVVAGSLVGVTSRAGGTAQVCGVGGDLYASIPAVASWIRQTITGAGRNPTGSPSTMAPVTDPNAPGGQPTAPGGSTGCDPNNPGGGQNPGTDPNNPGGSQNPGTDPNNPGTDPNNPGNAPGANPGNDPGQQAGDGGFPGATDDPGSNPGPPDAGSGDPGGAPGSAGGDPGFPDDGPAPDQG